MTDSERGLLLQASDPAALTDAPVQPADAPRRRWESVEVGQTRITPRRTVDEVGTLYRCALAGSG